MRQGESLFERVTLLSSRISKLFKQTDKLNLTFQHNLIILPNVFLLPFKPFCRTGCHWGKFLQSVEKLKRRKYVQGLQLYIDKLDISRVNRLVLLLSSNILTNEPLLLHINSKIIHSIIALLVQEKLDFSHTEFFIKNYKNNSGLNYFEN